MRLVKLCEWLPQPVQDYKPIPLQSDGTDSVTSTADAGGNET